MTPEERAKDIALMRGSLPYDERDVEAAIVRAIAHFVAEERERCARIAGSNDTGSDRHSRIARAIALEIRRGGRT